MVIIGYWGRVTNTGKEIWENSDMFLFWYLELSFYEIYFIFIIIIMMLWENVNEYGVYNLISIKAIL